MRWPALLQYPLWLGKGGWLRVWEVDRQLAAQREVNQKLEQRNAGLAQQIERKREHIRRLAENPAEQELEIRERLKLVHPNEKIYILGESARN